ncbi:MAG: hypothetical protein K9G76_12295 [Bacteroidales bacterium]|nr:hypothetical protein [Bacteroidales bacterium]MCF8405309.1 hypothetical protein [Bacteroidales bacterium]
MNAGFLQFCPILGDESQNIKNIALNFETAKDPDLLVLPELANSGYNFESKKQAILLGKSIEESEYVEFLVAHSKNKNLFIISGFLEKENNKLYNTAVLTGPSGYIGKYRKMHLFMNEPEYFEKGNLGLPLFELGGFKLGILICFDWIFPEVWRILALKGADIIAHPSNLVLPYAQQAVPVHGMINRTFNITANRYGNERGITFSGQSILSDPKGNTLIKAPAKGDSVEVTKLDLELARNKWITPQNHVFTDRFPAQYTDLIKA